MMSITMYWTILLLSIIATIEVSAVECPEGGAPFVPHPTDCSLYYQCNGDLPILMDCPDGLYFDPQLNVCNWPDQVDCQNKGLSFSHIFHRQQAEMPKSFGELVEQFQKLIFLFMLKFIGTS